MKWRVLILLMAGVSMIYLVSLLQDMPYPHPVVVQASLPKTSRVNEPTQVILSIHNDYVYRTHVHYEAVLDANRAYVRGVDSIKAGVNGLVIQSRKKKTSLLSDVAEEDWEVCFKHLLSGPISKISKSAEGTDSLQFAILYHVMDDQDIKHFARLYYFITDSHGTKSEYKDLLLPGNTMINAISLEQDTILYSRDPDSYRFRVAALPEKLMLPPHSEKASPILLTTGQTGDHVKANYQPNATEMYTGLLCRLYSSSSSTYRVYSLDIHKTKYLFHSSVTITDGISLRSKDHGVKTGKWVFRDHFSSKDKVIIDENLEYMAFVDGAHFHQETTEIEMPKPTISRSKYGKTVVVSLVRNNFQTLDFTDRLDALMNDAGERDHLYKTEDGKILQEFYHSMQAIDTVEPNETAYDASDIRGIQLNENGTLLAVWTKSKSIYIYKRGIADRLTKSWTDVGKIVGATSSYLSVESPHHLEKPLEWILRMVITPKEGHIGIVTPIGAAMFWNENNSNYISIGMKNNIVNTYLIDETEEQKAVNFQSFVRDKWDLWIVMTMIVTIFVVNEYKTYSY